MLKKDRFKTALKGYNAFNRATTKVQTDKEWERYLLLEEAVEKMTPKPLEDIFRLSNGWSEGICPNCDNIISQKYYRDHCNCGQALDWSDKQC